MAEPDKLNIDSIIQRLLEGKVDQTRPAGLSKHVVVGGDCLGWWWNECFFVFKWQVLLAEVRSSRVMWWSCSQTLWLCSGGKYQGQMELFLERL